MKYLFFTLLVISLITPVASATQQANSPLIKPKIVGGELASEGDWPWMSALVFTYNDIVSSLDVAGSAIDSNYFSNSPAGQASASMVDCGLGDNQCSLATDKICLIKRGEIDFSVKVDNCQAGGGIGAIIFNNIAGEINGTLGDGFTGSIPVVAISQTDGAALLSQLDSTATLSVSEQSALVQSSSCGASFIGSKWVLTAAHCVEDADITTLKVNVGEYDLSNGANNAKAVKQIYIHPQYNDGASFNNDIALIELTESLNHPSLTLASAELTNQFADMASYATVIGWGNRTAYGADDEQPANSQPDILHQVELSLLTNTQCKDKLAQGYSNLQNTTVSPEQVGITDTMLCAEFSGGGKGSCQGDSGGPLVINTNEGWQQVGVVSYGIGCADADFPDVYARVGEFTEWVNGITQGVAIEPNYDFAITPQNKAQTQQLSVTNNSAFTANLTYTLVVDKVGSTGFELNTDNCTTIAAKQSCQVQLSFDAKNLGEHKVRIVINSNNDNIPTSQSYISAQAIGASSNIATQLTGGESELLWFTGGDQNWQLDNTEAAIVSGNISDNQESSVMLTFSGSGTLSFDWSVSSEENTDSPDEPYDALYLIVDGEQRAFISGEVEYTTITIDDLGAGDHQIVWLYQKDELTSAGKDKGYLKNVSFTSDTIVTEPVPLPMPVAPEETSSSSGGSSSYLLLIILVLLRIRRRSH